MESRAIQVLHLQGFIVVNKFGMGFDALEEIKNKMPSKPVDEPVKPTKGSGAASPFYDVTTNAIAEVMKILPTETRTWLRGVVPPLVDTVFNNPTPPSEQQYPIGGENFTISDVKNIDSAVRSAMTKDKQKNKGSVGYGDYKKIQGKDDDFFSFKWDNPIAQTLGAFGYEVLPDGKIRVFDKYDSRNERTKQYLNKLNKEKETQHPLSLLWRDLKETIKENHWDAVKERPLAYFKELFTDPKNLFSDLAQITMNVVAENESTAKPVDFIYDPKTLKTYPTPIDEKTKLRPRFGDLSEQNNKIKKVKKSVKNKNVKGKGKV